MVKHSTRVDTGHHNNEGKVSLSDFWRVSCFQFLFLDRWRLLGAAMGILTISMPLLFVPRSERELLLTCCCVAEIFRYCRVLRVAKLHCGN